jgi:hypothetical protein
VYQIFVDMAQLYVFRYLSDMEMRRRSKITDERSPLPDENIQCAENSAVPLTKYRFPRRFRRFPASNWIELTARDAVVALVRRDRDGS